MDCRFIKSTDIVVCTQRTAYGWRLWLAIVSFLRRKKQLMSGSLKNQVATLLSVLKIHFQPEFTSSTVSLTPCMRHCAYLSGLSIFFALMSLKAWWLISYSKLVLNFFNPSSLLTTSWFESEFSIFITCILQFSGNRSLKVGSFHLFCSTILTITDDTLGLCEHFLPWIILAV